jgi:uroporphyrinogen-III synthase
MSPPLAHKTILVTRSAGQSSEFTTLLQAEGATVVEMPTLEIQPPSSWVELDGAIGQLETFDWLFLTSANAVNYFFDRCATLKAKPEILQTLKIAVVGQKTAQFLQARGFAANYTPPDFVADSLLENFPEPPAGQRILFPRVESGGREVLVEAFTAHGATITAVAAYQSGCPIAIDPIALAALESGEIDIVSFASSKTVQHFCQLLQQALGDRWQALLDPVIIASIGPQTTLTCETKLGRIDLEAQEYTLPGLTRAIVEFVTQKPLI